MAAWRQFFCLLLLGIFIIPIPAWSNYSNGIPVLLYHHVSYDNSDLPQLTVTPDEFLRQMTMLKQAGFQTISPQMLTAYMRQEPVDMPPKPIMITFDDGYQDNYTHAFPILKQVGFNAVIFMVGINVDRANRLSSQQIKDMSDYGIYFGGHSVNHRDLTTLQGKELNQEIRDVKRQLSRITNKEVNAFAYPCGYYNLRTWEAVEEAGYQAAFTVLPGLNKPEQDNEYLLRRIPIYSHTNFDVLFVLLDANQPKTKLLEYTPYIRIGQAINSYGDR